MLKKRWARGLAVGGAAVLLAFGFDALQTFRRLEWKSWDARLQIFADPARASKDIVLILVDQYSLDFYAKQGITWPWPRELYGPIVRHLAAGGAKACFFDIVMTERSRFFVEDDQKLAEAMRESGRVFVPLFLSTEEKESDPAGVAFLPKLFSPSVSGASGSIASNPSPDRRSHPPDRNLVWSETFTSITLPIMELLEAARGAANVRVKPDADGIFRRIPLLFAFRSGISKSTVAELPGIPPKGTENPSGEKTSEPDALKSMENSARTVSSKRTEKPLSSTTPATVVPPSPGQKRGEALMIPSAPWALASFVRPDLDPKMIPVDLDGQMIIRFFGPTESDRDYPYKTYSAAGVINSYAQIQEGLAPQVGPKEFEGKIVLIGLSAVGLLDIKATPFGGVIPGVAIQAAAVDTILNGLHIRVPGRGFTWIYIAILALLAGVVVSVLQKTVANTVAFAGFLLLPAAGAAAAFRAGVWLEFVAPEAAVLLALIGAAILNYSVEGRERRFLKGVFHHYLSPAVIDRILEDPDRLQLGGEQREITSFFSDVAGFTSISEALGPTELVALLNEYLTEMTDLILDSGGTLDKYEGDAIIAFWNAPLDDPDHALRAGRTALACQAKLSAMAPEFERKFGRVLRMRIGLNTGPAVVGNMGSTRRFDYTAIGDTINLAARLESAGKQYGLNLLAGEATVEKTGGAFVTREVDRIRVIGKAKPVRIFELIGETDRVPDEILRRLETYNRGLSLFRARAWKEAAAVFSGINGDPVATLYGGRCRAFEATPPPEDWDFVFDLKTK